MCENQKEKTYVGPDLFWLWRPWHMIYNIFILIKPPLSPCVMQESTFLKMFLNLLIQFFDMIFLAQSPE